MSLRRLEARNNLKATENKLEERVYPINTYGNKSIARASTPHLNTRIRCADKRFVILVRTSSKWIGSSIDSNEKEIYWNESRGIQTKRKTHRTNPRPTTCK